MNISEIGISKEINHKVLSGLKILMSGQTLLFRGMPCGLCEARNDSFAFYLIANEDGYIVGNDMPFDHIYLWLNNIPDEEITIGLAQITLSKLNCKNR